MRGQLYLITSTDVLDDDVLMQIKQKVGAEIRRSTYRLAINSLHSCGLVRPELIHPWWCPRMCQRHSLGWLRELSLIVVREALSALPYEFTLDRPEEILRHGRDEDQVAGFVHGCVDGVAGAASTVSLQFYVSVSSQ